MKGAFSSDPTENFVKDEKKLCILRKQSWQKNRCSKEPLASAENTRREQRLLPVPSMPSPTFPLSIKSLWLQWDTNSQQRPNFRALCILQGSHLTLYRLREGSDMSYFKFLTLGSYLDGGSSSFPEAGTWALCCKSAVSCRGHCTTQRKLHLRV